jgi:predicted  nucleic acid-binding Zn-ribbon protein
MNSLQMMPTSIWALASATIIMIVLITLVLNLYYRKRLQAIGPLNTDIGDLVNQKQQLETDIDSIRDWIANQNDELLRIKAEREEQEITRAELLRLEQEASQKEEDNKKLRDEVGSLENQRHLLVQSMEKVESEKSSLEKDIQTFKKTAEKAATDLKEIEKTLESSVKKEKEINEAVARAELKVQDLEKGAKSLQDEIKEAQKKLSELDRDMDSKKRDIKDLERRYSEKDREIDTLEKREIALNAQVQAQLKKIESAGILPLKAFDSLNYPVFERLGTIRDIGDESKALDQLYKLTLDSGFELPERLQNAFHTSLKTSDISCLTVMAGVSGTGKSAYPKLYAQSMGLHFLPLAVEPRWDSPQDLFGFLNYMENRFEATTLGRSLVQFNNSPHVKKHNTLKDQMLLVLLDEMNLARVEYYFSEFLSKLEMRRNINVKDKADYRMVSTEIYAGRDADEAEGTKGSDPAFLYAGSNVLFVGTMNEDETTQSLSDKVIDRANVLYFGKPEKLKNQRQQIDTRNNWAPIKEMDWKSWFVQPTPESIGAFDKVDEAINNINSTLSDLGRPFGWRTYKAMMTYIANHPSVKILNGTGLEPLADQVAMRVMPKLRGLDLTEYESVFNKLGSQLRDIDDSALSEAYDLARGSAQGFFDWRGIKW